MRWLDDRPPSWDPVRDDFPWSRLRRELDDAGVDDVILVQAGTSTEETVALLDLADREGSVLGVVGWVSLSSPKATESDLAVVDNGASKLVGIRSLHRWEPDGEILADAGVSRSCHILAERHLTLDLFVNDHTELALLPPILEAAPDGRYVIDHLGRPPIEQDLTAQKIWADSMSRLADLPNVYVKFSGWGTVVQRTTAADVSRYRDHVLSTFGPDRTMYASNWPVGLVAADYNDTYKATLDALAEQSPESLTAILGNTARAFYLGHRKTSHGVSP